MNITPQFNAPWSRELWMMTLLSAALCVGVPVILLTSVELNGTLLILSAVLPVVVLVAGAAFTVRGYTIRDRVLLIHRFGWISRLPLNAMIDAQVDPHALQSAIRIFGNGGAFAFCGWMYNKKLGRFLLYATDPARSVVLRFPHRNVVVTPDDLIRFVSELSSRTLN